MFYPIKMLLPVQLCERKVFKSLKWIEVALMLVQYQQRAAVLIQAPFSQLETSRERLILLVVLPG